MKTIQFKTEVILNANDQYRIEINGKKQPYVQFGTKKELTKFVKENEEFKKTYNRIRHRETGKLYQEEFEQFVLIIDGEHKGSFACVNKLKGVMSRLTNGKWTMTAGNKGNNVQGHSEFDVTRWTINKRWELFVKQVVTGKKNHFNEAKKLHKDDANIRLAQLLNSLSDEDFAEVMKNVNRADVKIEEVEVKEPTLEDQLNDLIIEEQKSVQANNVVEVDFTPVAKDTVIEVQANNVVEVDFAKNVQDVEVEPEEDIVENFITEIVKAGGNEWVLRNKIDNWNIYKLSTAIETVGSIGNQDHRMYIRQVEIEYLKLFKNSVFKKAA